MKAAVIGIGSNSVRMLLAEINGQEGRKLLRDREGTRLFAGLDAQGNLSRASMDASTAAVKRKARSRSTCLPPAPRGTRPIRRRSPSSC